MKVGDVDKLPQILQYWGLGIYGKKGSDLMESGQMAVAMVVVEHTS